METRSISEKAKGKQRATEPPNGTDVAGASSSSQPPTEPSHRDLVVRFTDGLQDLTVTVEKRDIVKDIKRKIREARPELKDRRLRLIYLGRLLTDGTFLHDWLVSLEEKQRRVTTEDGEPLGKPTATTIWIHCSVGPKIEAEDVGEDEKEQATQLRPVRGFDRLAVAGFSEADIANFRRQFHNQSSSNYLDVDFETEEEYDEHFRALEEQWIDSIDNAGSAVLSQSSSTSFAVLQGTMIGFFFPIMPFFFMKNSKPAVFWEDDNESDSTNNVVFSRRMQMGLVIGFLANILFGMWRLLLDTD